MPIYLPNIDLIDFVIYKEYTFIYYIVLMAEFEEQVDWSDGSDDLKFQSSDKSSEKSEKSEKSLDSNQLVLKLGDIIELVSPANAKYHQKTFYINYIDDAEIEILDVNTAFKHILSLYDSGELTDESITRIHLLSRAPDEGYAKQNGLLVGKWINVHFNGEVPTVITGEITNLDEDMIEVMTYPDVNMIYINFEYKGIPRFLPIEKIVLREIPKSIKGSLRKMMDDMSEEGEIPAFDSSKTASMETMPNGEIAIIVPDNPKMDPNFNDIMKDLIFNAKDIVFGEEEEIEIRTEVKRSEQKYGIDIQLNDLMDELLSTIPTNKRTERVKQRVKTIVSRFKELREQFSQFDANGNVTGYKNFDAAYKPLVEHLKEMDTNLRWLLPVVKQQMKFYGVDEESENDFVDKKGNVFDIMEMTEKQAASETYSAYYENINENFTPFTNIENANKKEVKTNLDMIVDNFDNYYGNVFSKVLKLVEHNGGQAVAKMYEVKNRRFIIQKYNLGMSKMLEHTMKSGKTVYMRGAMTQNDSANVKSLLMLPNSAVHFSRVDLPGTGVIDRVNLSHNWLYYFNLLRTKTNVEKLSAKKPIDYEDIDGAYFASKMIGFSTDDGNKGINYDELLNNVIPRSRSIIHMLRDEVPNPYSFYNMISFYEPFLIYPDNITYSAKTAQDKRKGEEGDSQKGGAYNEIRFHVKEMVKKYKADMASKGSEFTELLNKRYDSESSRIPNVLYRVLTENHEFLKSIKERYRLSESDVDGTETLNRILITDGGAAYMATLSLMMGSLFKPDLAKLVKNLENDTGAGNMFESKYKIAKKYGSVRDMLKDNNTEDVWYDKEFDNTPYNIMSKYEEDQKKMLPEKFIDYLKLVLIEKHDAEPETAEELALTLIAKKRRINDGNYAMLTILPTSKTEIKEQDKEAVEIEENARKKVSFYVRRKNIWIPDNDVDENDFEMFEEKSKIKSKHIDEIVEYAVGDMETHLKNRAKYHMNLLKKIQWIKESNAKQHDIYAYMLGTQIIESGFGIQSPYEGLRDYILSQSDIVKRSADILRFRDNFCRDAVNDEPLQWLYCVDTNVKLLPKFFYDLAHCYVNGNDYEAELDRICRHSGKLSEDQESIVDKHSGYVIKSIDFADDMGYFKTVESSSDDADIQHVLGRKTKSGKKVFEDETTQHIYNIASALCEYMSVDFEVIEERIMQLSVEFVKSLDSADAYKTRQDKAAKKNIKIASYQTYIDQNKIYYTACMTFVAIQTAVPSFKPKKTFPGCVFSFGGYPLEAGEENTVGLKYMACVIDNIKSQVAPWNSISNQKRDGILTRLMELMTKRIVLHPTVADLYLRKKEQPTDVDEIPVSHDITKWTQFQPPIVKFSVTDKKTSPGVSVEFREELANAMKKGNASQRQMLGTIFQKIISNSYSVVESINKIVATAGKDAILRAGTIVFLENACCEDNGQSKAIDFFKAANENIQKHIDIAKIYSMIYNDTTTLCRAPYLFYPKIEGKKSPFISNDKHSEEAIYEAFIHYCKLNVDAPVPDDLERFYQKDDKPMIEKGADLLQTIEIMKKHGKVHNNKSLEDLMQIVAHRNIVHLNSKDEITNPVMGFSDLLEHLLEKNVIDQPLHRILTTLIDQYLKMSPNKKDTVNELKQYLKRTNRNMLAVIDEHVVDNSSLTKRDKNKLKTFLANVGAWTCQNDNEIMFKSSQFMRNCVHYITKVVSSILCGGNDEKQFSISEKRALNLGVSAKHWEFSENHRKKILKFSLEKFAKLDSFMNNSGSIMCDFFKNNTDLLINLNLFITNIPIFSDQTLLFDREAVQLLHIYAYYSLFHDLIIDSSKEEYVKMEMVHIKKARRNAEEPDAFKALDDEDAAEDLLGADEYDIVVGKQQEFKKRVCDLFTIMIEIDMENKSTINLNYAELSDKVYKAGKAEKKTITDRFETMDAEDRGVENLLKTYRIGEWNAGNEKGLFKYDANTYDKEISGQMVANAATADVNDLQADMEAQADADADREANDITGLGDNYMDGAYYEEDADRDE